MSRFFEVCLQAKAKSRCNAHIHGLGLEAARIAIRATCLGAHTEKTDSVENAFLRYQNINEQSIRFNDKLDVEIIRSRALSLSLCMLQTALNTPW